MFVKKVKILFIDDNNPNNVLTQAVIDADDMAIESFYAQSIDQAISLLEGFEAENKFPKFIFSDINLPLKDGYYFAKYYAEHFYENNKEVEMYFMSADFQQDQLDELMKYPFIYGVYVKPFRDEIYDEVIRDELDKINENNDIVKENGTTKNADYNKL